MSSEYFENREDDYRTIYSDITSKMQNQLPRAAGEEKKKLIRDIERNIEEATLMIQEMEDELRKAPAQYRRQMVSRVRMYKKDLEQATRDMQKQQSSQTRSNNPFDDPYDDRDEFEREESSHRARLMAGNESLGRASESIARSHRIAAETDQIGVEIIDELGTQRESLVRTRDRLHDTDSNLTKSRKILKTMALRAMTNKLILAVIIFLECGILAGVIYWKFFT